jgi:hypothetical protein
MNNFLDGLTFGPIRRSFKSRGERRRVRAAEKKRQRDLHHELHTERPDLWKDPGDIYAKIQAEREKYKTASKRDHWPNDPPGALCHECKVQGWHSTGTGRGVCAALKEEGSYLRAALDQIRDKGGL